MTTLKSAPQIYLFSQNRRTCIGAIANPTEFTEDIRFNAYSEISFTVADKYYDIDKEEWVDNPYYDNIERHKLVYITDNRDYFRYPVRAIGDANFYKYKDSTQDLWNRSGTLRYNQNLSILDNNFQVQDETELFDIGKNSGYKFRHFNYIRTAPSSSSVDEHGAVGHKVQGAIQDMSTYHWSKKAGGYNHLLAVDTFIPVKSTDVIAINNDGTPNNPAFQWKVVAYKNAAASEYVNYWYKNDYGSARYKVATILPDGGYVRFECRNIPNTSGCSYSYSEGKGSYIYTIPVAGYARIYSGERRCTKIKNSNTNGWNTSKMHWFQIQDVNETMDGVCRIKTVKALSYEYSLCQSTFSLSENTLPLYIPEPITDLVNSDNWIRDKVDNNTVYRSAQHMERGILNQILDRLPGWTIKNVSSELMTSYRNLSDVDDANIYTYLMDTIQSVYNCFIVFDNDDMTISAYSLSDINNLKTPICLTWDNSIKLFNKENLDASYYTALRVRGGDDTYGVGLINPTGNAMIYNFDNIMDDLDYSLPGVPNAYKRTLKEAVTSWKSIYDSQMSNPSANLTYARNIISYNMDLVKYESAMLEALAEYRAKADEINTFLNEDRTITNKLTGNIDEFFIPDLPWSVQRIKEGAYGSSDPDPVEKQFHSGRLQSELENIANAYWGAKNSYDNTLLSFNAAMYWKKNIALRLTMSYSQAYKANNGNEYAYSNSTTVLSAAEIKELSRYIVEGTWNFENAAFSETYDYNDIFNTLSEILSEAQYDLDNRLSIVNFDFSVDTANILAIPEFEKVCKTLYMGYQIGLNVSHSEYVTPMLLEFHRNYKDDNDFSFSFTTDMKRKPIEFRFADLYSTIAQTSVTDSTFTFDK